MQILLIEDDQIEIMKFKRIVGELNEHDFHTLPDGEKALEYLNDALSLPELILLDLNMPKMNGLEFLEQLKKSRYTVEKLQRELESSREEWEVTLNYQVNDQIEPLQVQIAEAEEE